MNDLWDCSVTYGHRGEAEQNQAFADGASTKKWPDSKHNKVPSEAVDVMPRVHGRITDDPRICRVFGGFVMGIAAARGIHIRWGGDWDGDRDVNDQRLNDLVHFEIIQ